MTGMLGLDNADRTFSRLLRRLIVDMSQLCHKQIGKVLQFYTMSSVAA